VKVLVLGIDALDCLLLDEFAGHLPNLAGLRRGATSLGVRSTFPPDSDTAWATISTGLNPAQHGIVRFVDPLEKSYQILNVRIDNRILQGKTFWEIIGRAGYRTFAIFPHLCYPIWQTPGVMVARGSNVADVQANPPDILGDYPSPDILPGVRGLPERGIAGLTEYVRNLTDLTRADAEFALKLMQKHAWDLFFVYWSTLDAIGHFFWSYFDPDDPSFTAGHPLQGVIQDAYKLYDEIVGRFLDAVDDDVTVILVSDHGHGIRPCKLANVNEVLRQGGFLAARNLQTHPHIGAYEKVKRLGVHTISRLGLGRIAGRMMRRFPGAIQAFTRPASIDWQKTIAYASDMSGIKAYSYGGIIVNRSALGQREYETVRREIIELLQEACVLPDGESMIRFVARREDLYSGPFVTNYPDIVLEFKYGYGLGWAVYAPLITEAASHNLVPGSHRGDTGTFLMRGHRPAVRDTVDLHDITPTLLDLMGVTSDVNYDGRSIFAKDTK
jgi:predicted AlkP superfamily phosphohydrolase/phosphomutase